MKNKNKFLLILMSVFFMMSQSISAYESVDPPSTNDPSQFITHWITTDGTITIPTIGAGYNYDITWMNLSNSSGSSLSGQNGDVTISGLQNGATYEIAISGDFPRIYLKNAPDRNKIVAVTQWGTNQWSSMNNAFNGASNLNITASDTPDLSSVTDMYYMFRGAENLTGTQGNWNWNTDGVTNMSAVFFGASNFNGDISGWNTANVTNMASMFADAVSFDQNIGNWNTANVKSMKTMFRNAQSFSQNLGGWDLTSLTNATGMFNVASEQGMDCYSFTSTLTGWAANPNTPNNIVLGADHRTVFTLTDVNYLENSKGWTILGHDGSCEVDESQLFKTEWITYDGTITIPTIGNGYNYNITWTNLANSSSTTATEITGDYTITGLQNGVTYEVAIAGIFPRIYFNDSGDKEKLMAITQWGAIQWTSMNSAFYGASNLEIMADDTPDLSNVEDMYYMFMRAESITGSQGNWNWNTENVKNMSATFFRAYSFNGDITGWDVSNVTNMSSMFFDANSFNQNINNWNTTNVKNMKGMFRHAKSFNQSLANWDLSSLTRADGMFNAVYGYGIDCKNLGETLEGWALNSNTPNNIDLGAMDREVGQFVLDNYVPMLMSKGWTFPGMYTSGCGTSSTPMSAVVDNLTDVVNNLEVTVYPNPTDGVFTLVSEAGAAYVVMDIYGRTILSNQITDTKTVIDLTAYPRGIYYVQVGDQIERIVLK